MNRLVTRTLSTLRPLRLYSTTSNNELNAKLLSKDIPTVKLAYDVYNSSLSAIPLPPIIILHGLFGSKSNNRTIAKQLNESLEREVYCVDLRNHGDSPHDERHDYSSLAADVEKFIEDHDLGPSILLGHSMGAKTAMALALRRSSFVNMLISVDNAPVNLQPSSTFIKYIQIMQQIVDNKDITSSREANNYFAKFEKDISIRQFLLQNIKKDPSEGVMKSRIPLDIMKEAIVKGNIAAWEFDSNLNRWMGPALFIRGTKSMYVPDEYIPDIGNFFPAFETRDIEAGHWVIAEKPEETLEAITDFIQRHEDI